MARKDIGTRIEENLYIAIKIIAAQQGRNANDLIEEGMQYIIEKYGIKDYNK